MRIILLLAMLAIPQETFTPTVQFGNVIIRSEPIPMPVTGEKAFAYMNLAQARFSHAMLEIRQIDPEKVDRILEKYKIELEGVKK